MQVIVKHKRILNYWASLSLPIDRCSIKVSNFQSSNHHFLRNQIKYERINEWPNSEWLNIRPTLLRWIYTSLSLSLRALTTAFSFPLAKLQYHMQFFFLWSDRVHLYFAFLSIFFHYDWTSTLFWPRRGLSTEHTIIDAIAPTQPFTAFAVLFDVTL